jgi:hypothetical protein
MIVGCVLAPDYAGVNKYLEKWPTPKKSTCKKVGLPKNISQSILVFLCFG